MRRGIWPAMLSGTIGVLILALVGNGQERLGLAGRGDSLRLALLRSAEVRRELRLTDEQIDRIGRIEAESKQTKKQFDSATKGEKGKPKAKLEDPNLTDAQRRAILAREAQLDGFEQQTDARLDAVLTARQRTRLSQLVLRVQGPSAFLTPEVIEKLGILPDQLQAIREVLGVMKGQQDQYKEAQKRSSELAKAGGEFALEKVRKDQEKSQGRAFSYRLGQQAMPEIGRILSRHQRDLYNQLIGPPFELGKLTDRNGEPLLDESANLGAWLLKQPAIHDELKLTTAQRNDLANGKPAGSVLDARQRARLNQIALQGEGLSALARPDVIRALRLDDDQLEQIQGTLGGLMDESRRLHDQLKAEAPDPAAAGLDPAVAKEQARERMRAGSAQLRQDVSRRVAAVLTRRQNEAFQRLLGEPFDFGKLRSEPGAAPPR
ncbi:MAG: hypothetical protein ACYC61_15585 [Isosphaeraceae bacterium]